MAVVPYLEKAQQLGEELLDNGRVERVDDRLPGALRLHQLGLLEHAQVVRDARRGDVEVRSDLAGGHVALAEQAYDLAPRRVGKRV